MTESTEPKQAAPPAGINQTLIDAAERANLANIIKKLKAGKTLTAADRNALSGSQPGVITQAQRDAKAEKKVQHTAERAAFWCCALRTMQLMIAAGVPVDSPVDLIAWFDAKTTQAKSKCTPSFRRRIAEEREKLLAFIPLGGAVVPGRLDQDWNEFEAQARTEDPRDAMGKITKARDWAYFKFEKASKANDKDNEKHYADMLAKMEGVFHDAQIRAKRLGLDSGDLYPRAEHERVVAAWAYQAMRCIDTALESLARKCVGLASAQEARRVLEPALLDAAYVAPFVHSAKVATGMAMPDWFVEKMCWEVGNYITKGTEQMNDAVKPNADPA